MSTFSKGEPSDHSSADTWSPSQAAGVGLIDIGYVAGILWRHKMKIVVTAILFLCMGFGYATLTPKTYRATATLLIDPRQERALNVEAVLGGIGADSAAISSQLEVIRSRTLLRGVFDDLGLQDLDELGSSSLLDTLRGMIGQGTPPPDPDTLFETFRDRVSAEREGLTYVLRVSFISGDPRRAALVANAIVERYLLEQTRAKSLANTGVSAQINDRIADLQDQVTQREQAVETFKASHGIVSSGSGTPLRQAQIDQLSSQLVVAQANLRDTQARLDQAIAASQNGSDQISPQLAASSPNLLSLLEERDALTIEINRLSSSLGPLHPRLEQLRLERADLAELIRVEKNLLVAQITSERDLARSQMDATQSELEVLTSGLQQNNTLEIELRQLERQAEASRVVLESFLQRAQETQELGGFESADAVVLSAAVPPSSALWPRGSLILAFSLMLGLIAGALWAFFAKDTKKTAPIRPLDPTPSPERSYRTVAPNNDSRELRIVDAPGAPAQAPAATALAPLVFDMLERTLAERLAHAQSPSVIFVRGHARRAERIRAAYRLAQRLTGRGCRTLLLDREPEITVALDARFQHRRVSDLRKGNGNAGSLYDPARKLDLLVDDMVQDDREDCASSVATALLRAAHDVIVVNDTEGHEDIDTLKTPNTVLYVLCLSDAELGNFALPLHSAGRVFALKSSAIHPAQKKRTA